MKSLIRKVATPIMAGLILPAIAIPLLRPPAASGESDETVYYLLTDHLGSVDVILDEDGQVVERRDYLPYGSERITQEEPGAPETDYGFTGKELDDETGLQYYGARYYDPLIGRFVSIDPVVMDEGSKPLADILSNPQALNAYSYVLNNPIKYVDPTGTYEIDVHMYLTTYLASNAGFDEMDAFSIGLYDQMTDSDPNTTPWNPANSQYHFPNKEDLDNLASEAIGTLENKKIGQYLHATQDRFAHSGFNPYLGGHIWWGHRPDKTYLDQKRANVMAEDSFKRLRLFNRLKNGLNGMELDEYNEQTDQIWFQIRDEVYEFNAKETLDEKLDVLGMSNPEKQGEDDNN